MEAWISPESASKVALASTGSSISATPSQTGCPGPRLSAPAAAAFWFGVCATVSKASAWFTCR